MSRVRTSLLAALLVGSLAACGGSNDEPAAADAPAAAQSTATLAPGTKLSANDATEAQLRTIPGVGEKIADEIMEYRPYDAATGETKFRKELAKYISEAEIDKIVPYLTFG